MSDLWKSAGEKPQITKGKKLAVRMRGSRFGLSLVEEIDGFYLNEYGLHNDDGCQCFTTEAETEASGHDDIGCPHTGFYVTEDNPDFEEGVFVDFRAVEWCKR